MFEGLQHGRINRSLFTLNANAYFSEQALADFASSLGPLGTPQEFVELAHGLRGRYDLATVPDKIFEADAAADDVYDARWQAGAVSDCGRKLSAF
jgi:hypothetical protein